MGNYLIINTAENTEILVISGGKSIYRFARKVMASENLLPMLSAALSELNINLDDVDVFGAVTGPGSFTGIRIGVSTVRAFAYALHKKAVGVSFFDVLRSNSDSNDCAVAITSSGDICYFKQYFSNDDQTPITVKLDQIHGFKGELVCDGVLCKRFNDCKTTSSDGADLQKAFMPHLLVAQSGTIDEYSYKKLLPVYLRKAQPERVGGEL